MRAFTIEEQSCFASAESKLQILGYVMTGAEGSALADRVLEWFNRQENLNIPVTVANILKAVGQEPPPKVGGLCPRKLTTSESTT